jgi:hypothetical protein
MTLPSSDSLKAQFTQGHPSQEQRLGNFKSNLRLAYRLVAKENRKSHQRNKRYYDPKAKPQKFTVNELVYLYHPATKPGLTRKVFKIVARPVQIY